MMKANIWWFLDHRSFHLATCSFHSWLISLILWHFSIWGMSLQGRPIHYCLEHSDIRTMFKWFPYLTIKSRETVSSISSMQQSMSRILSAYHSINSNNYEYVISLEQNLLIQHKSINHISIPSSFRSTWNGYSQKQYCLQQTRCYVEACAGSSFKWRVDGI